MMKTIRLLFGHFFLLGFTTFGGGLAMLPSLKQFALSHHWLKEEEWADTVALAQLTPGAIAINLVHMIGYRAGKRLGAMVSVFAMLLPSFLVILLVAIVLQPYLDTPWVQGTLQGILLAVVWLIAKALFDLASPLKKNPWGWLLVIGVFIVVSFRLLSPLWVIFLTLIGSLLFSLLIRKSTK